VGKAHFSYTLVSKKLAASIARFVGWRDIKPLARKLVGRESNPLPRTSVELISSTL
jgi:hypothetical protein